MGMGYGLAMGLGRALGGYMDGREDARRRQFEEQRALEAEKLRAAQQQAFLENMVAQSKRAEQNQQADFLERGLASGLTPEADAQIASVERNVAGVSPFAGAAAGAVGAIQRRNLGAGRVTKIGPSTGERLEIQRRRTAEADRYSDRAFQMSRDEAARAARAAEIAAEQAFRTQDREDRQQFEGGQSAAMRDLQREIAGMRATPGGVNAPRTMTEGQRRAATVAAQLESELAALDGLQEPGARDLLVDRLPFGMGRPALSENAQRFNDAASSFAQHYIYGLSGAAAPDAEVERVAASITPRIGDSEATKAAKRARRRDMVAHLQTMAGGSEGADSGRPSLASFVRP